MIFDVQNTLAGTVANFAVTGFALSTAGAGTYPGAFTSDSWGQASLPLDAIGNTINIDPGPGKEVKVVIEVVTLITTAAGATIQWQIVMCDDAAQTTNVTVLNASRVWTVPQIAALNGGTGLGVVERLVVPLNTVKRYLGFQYVVGTGALSAGAVYVGAVIDEQASVPTL